jgi:AhpD family alkylhydroperoxidase
MFTPKNIGSQRALRAGEAPLMPGLPEAPGILVAMSLTPAIGEHLRGLAQALLVDDFPGSTLSRHERELLATGVSAANECFFCMDSHAAFAEAVATYEGADAAEVRGQAEALRQGQTEGLSGKMKGLLTVALNVQEMTGNYEKEAADVAKALEAGATPGDLQHTVAIAAAFSMYNRFVEGFRAATAPVDIVYGERAGAIALHGYTLPPESGLAQ